MADISVTAKTVRPLPGALIETFTAGGAGSVGDAVYEDSNGKVQKAQANTVATAKAIGIVVSAGALGATSFAPGDAVSVARKGRVIGFIGMTPGAKVYVSAATAGKLADAVPTAVDSQVWVVGEALNASTVEVDPLNVNPQAKIADPTGGVTVDAEARTAINAVIAALEKQGIIAVNG